MTQLHFSFHFDIGKIYAADKYILHNPKLQSLWLWQVYRIVSQTKRLNRYALFIGSGNWDPQSVRYKYERERAKSIREAVYLRPFISLSP
jgi:hypothetical protein